jgi:uncharacterized small protein (DUF1192 family)
VRLVDRLIDLAPRPVNVRHVDLDDILGPRPDDPLTALIAQDLDRLSVAELEARVKALEAEIARTRRKIDGAVTHRASADALFRR